MCRGCIHVLMYHCIFLYMKTNRCVYVYVICIHACICICICICMNTNHIHIHTSICLYVQKHTMIHQHMYTPPTHILSLQNLYIYIYMYIWTYSYQMVGLLWCGNNVSNKKLACSKRYSLEKGFRRLGLIVIIIFPNVINVMLRYPAIYMQSIL